MEYRLQGGAGGEWLEKAESRYNKLMSGLFYAANALDPEYTGSRLTTSEWKLPGEFINQEFPETYGEFLNYVGGGKQQVAENFKNARNCKKKNFLRSQQVLGLLVEQLTDIATRLLSLVPSSASIERGFSTMGYTHSELRNRLSHTRVQKLSFCRRMLKKN